MVSSNKGQRKGTLSRRETSAEESQTINKTSLIDHGKYYVFCYVIIIHDFGFGLSSSIFVLY